MKINLPLVVSRVSLFLFCLSSGFFAFAQDTDTVRGTVVNGVSQPLGGTVVKVKGKNAAVFTDEDGKFRINASNHDVLEFSNPKYISQEEPIYDPSAVNVVLGIKTSDIIASAFKLEAALDFRLRTLPTTRGGWESYRIDLLKRIAKASGLQIDHTLPLDYHETGSLQMKEYSIKKIYFQTRPGVYATANLYVPDGNGRFPAVINMNGHWDNAKAGEMVQSVAHELALNGYVCLNIDAWGAGERSTLHGVQEYHGSNLGASLLNIGESLLANQVSDNMRGVDLLCSLPYVDQNNIGATGASGGGNQTMWLSALDERIKACMPVVSAGTFQSCVIGSNCICELMPGGLTFTEESGVLGLIAPRAVQLCSALQDVNPTFYPSEMIRTFINAKPIFALYGKADDIRYRLFNTTHGYWPEMRQALISWLDLKLKGIQTSETRKEFPFTVLTNEQLMVFPKGKRSTAVMGTYQYCMLKGRRLSDSLYAGRGIDQQDKLNALRELLFLDTNQEDLEKIENSEPGSGDRKILLVTKNNHIIPLHYFPANRQNHPLAIIYSDEDSLSREKPVIDDYIQKGYAVLVASVWGVGENCSPEADAMDYRAVLHTLSRSALWLGHSVLGEWVADMHQVVNYAQQYIKPNSIVVDAKKELAVGALLESALFNNVDTCLLANCPISYVIDRKEGINYFNMSMHLPGILKWGDISLIAALNRRATVILKQPVSITGEEIEGEQLSAYKAKFSRMFAAVGNNNNFYFSEQ